MEVPLLEFKQVTKRFDGKLVFDNLDLQLFEGQITAVIGKSGTGKTVLLKHIVGLLEPDSGEIFFRGKPVSTMTKQEKAQYHRQFSYMFQGNALFDHMTVYDNVALPLRETTRLKKTEIEEKAMSRIHQVDLADAAHKYPAELSGGMQKRAALARALVTDPSIVLFDEPTTGQDPIRKNVILSMIAQYKKRFGFTAVVISHEIPDIFFISDRIILLWEGKAAFQGSWEEARNSSLPMNEEYLASLEGFADELTGLLSKQMFRSRYQMELSAGNGSRVMVAVVFSVELDLMTEALGPEAALQVVKRLGEYVSQHLDTVGGFSTRLQRDHILTVFPQLEREDVEPLVRSFSEGLRGRALGNIQSRSQADINANTCFNIRVYAGIAEITPNSDMEAIFRQAASHKQMIAEFQCDSCGGKQA